MNLQQSKKEHIHSYMRSHYTTNGKKVVYKCADPLCPSTWTVPRDNRSLLLGNASLCPECHQNVFILDSQYALKVKIPKCQMCRGGNSNEEKKSTLDKAHSIISDLFSGIPQAIEKQDEK